MESWYDVCIPCNGNQELTIFFISDCAHVKYFVTALVTVPLFAASLYQPSGKPIDDFLSVS